MTRYILIDDENICRCIASDLCNLHKDKVDAGMITSRINKPVNIGDEVIVKNKECTVIPRPENYPPLYEEAIQAEMRRAAIQTLITKKELPDDYT